ncbi:hypothetical protein FRC17_001139 [Serendipita sp. 399]|nr:hypothetical protein FRC17_001139 [Serendipita sp. 399]
MERQGALQKILEIATIGRSLLSSRASTSPQPQQAQPAQPTPPPSRRRLVPPKIPFPRSKQLRPRLHQLGVPSTASQRLSEAYRRRVLALSQTVKAELRELWRNIAANPRYSEHVAKEKYTLSAHAILCQYQDALSTSFESAVVAVKAHFNVRENSTVNGRFDERYVCLLEWAFEFNRYPSQEEKSHMALNSGLTYRQISVWFQNRRSRVKRKEQEYLEAVARGENPPPLPVRRFRLPPPPGFLRGRPESSESTTPTQEDDSSTPELPTPIDTPPPTVAQPNTLDDFEIPDYAYPEKMKPREWYLPTFDPPECWPRQNVEVSDEYHPVHPGEVQLLYRQLKMMTVEPMDEDPDIIDMVNDYQGHNVEVSSDSDSESDDNQDAESQHTADDEADAANQEPFAGPTFAEHMAKRAARVESRNDEEEELLPPGDYSRMRKTRVRPNRVRRPPLRRDPDSSDGEREDEVQEDSDTDDDMEIEEQGDETNSTGSPEITSLDNAREDNVLSADESDGSQSGSSQAYSDLCPIDVQISTHSSLVMDSQKPDGCFLPAEPLEIPECFNQTFSSHIAEQALKQTLEQLGIPPCTRMPPFSTPELLSYSWDPAPEVSLTVQDSTSTTVRVAEFDRYLIDNNFALDKTERIQKRTRAEKLQDKLLRRAQRRGPVVPPLESLTFANIADYDHPYFPPNPSLEECKRIIEAEEDPMRFLTFEHHQEPEDDQPQPAILADNHPVPPHGPLPAIIVSSEPDLTQTAAPIVVFPPQQPVPVPVPASVPDAHLPPQPQPAAGGTENRPEQHALLGRLFHLLTRIPRTVWESLGIYQRSADEPRLPPLIPFDPEVMFEIPETDDNIESIFPPLQLPDDLFPPLDPLPDDPYAVTDDGATIPALW